MTFIELLAYVGSHCKYDIMDGDVNDTLAKSQSGAHKNPIVGKVIADMYLNSGVSTPEDAIERAQAIKTLGRKLMARQEQLDKESRAVLTPVKHTITVTAN